MGFKKWISGGYQAQAQMNVMTLSVTGMTLGKFSYDVETQVLKHYGEAVAAHEIIDIELTHEIPEKRITATRVVLGGVTFGLLGAAVGALARKQVSASGWIIIDVPGGQWLIEVMKGKADLARQLVHELQKAKVDKLSRL